MSRKLGVVMDPIGSINYKKDTTLALLWAAQDRGWTLFFHMSRSGLFLDGGSAHGQGATAGGSSQSRALVRP